MQSYGAEKIVLQRTESVLPTKTVRRDRRQEPDMKNIRNWIFSLRITRKKEVERLVPIIGTGEDARRGQDKCLRR